MLPSCNEGWFLGDTEGQEIPKYSNASTVVLYGVDSLNSKY